MTTALHDLKDEFDFLDSWEERYAHIIAMGKSLPPLPETYQTEAYRVKGCMSQVWLVVKPGADGRPAIQADSDAFIVRGLIAIALRLVDNLPAQAIAAYDFQSAFQALDLTQHLSSQRNNGLVALTERLKAEAQALAA